jgi:hypothetical protein
MEEKESEMIGIRLADRSVFRVFPDERPGKRRVILSTSHEGQDRVEIPIVRFTNDPGAGPAPIILGTLRLEDLAVLPRDEQEIQLTLTLGSSGSLAVAATDTGSGNVESISINLAQATAEAAYVVPESLTSLPAKATTPRRRLWPAILVLLVLIVLLGGALWLAFGTADRPVDTDATGGKVVAESESDQGEAETSAAPAPSEPDEPAAGDQAVGGAPEGSGGDPAASTTSAETSADSAPPVGSIEYRIRRGDTLWDLANSFYGNPWLYPTLAETNRIPDPDLIFAEDKLTVPGDPEPSR